MVSKKKQSKKKLNVIYVSGKRKTSIARAIVKPGKGVVRINSFSLDAYSPQLALMKVKEALMIAGDAYKNLDFNVSVEGGGVMSQAEAVRLVIAKGIVNFTKDELLKEKYLSYDRHLLVADTRRTESQKPCRSSARRGKQTSKR